MNQTHFTFSERVLPNIPYNSILIVDKASYYMKKTREYSQLLI